MKKNTLGISFLLSLTFALQCCENKSRQAPKNEPETVIKEVSVSVSGGLRTIPSKAYTITITKDRVYYRLFAIDTTRNITKSYANTEQDWEKLLSKIDLDKFKAAENRASHQPYDGIDTEITITTQNGKYLKTNADNSPGWDRVYKQLVETYYKRIDNH